LNKLGAGKCIALPGDLSKYDECVKLAEELAKREEGEPVVVIRRIIPHCYFTRSHAYTAVFVEYMAVPAIKGARREHITGGREQR